MRFPCARRDGTASFIARAAEGSKGGGEEATLDYGLYRSFWRLQQYALRQDEAVKGDKAKDTWKCILEDVDKILGAFEVNAFSSHDLRLAKERWAAASGRRHEAINGKRKRGQDMMDVAEESGGGSINSGGGGLRRRGQGEGYFGLKYLTSSRLLRLQLRDPTLRLQILTQWLILAASLKSKVGKDKDSPNSPTDLNPRMERAKRLVKATPPRGEDYLKMLQTVLHRESAWTRWKDGSKCRTPETVAAIEQRAAAAKTAAEGGDGKDGGGSTARIKRLKVASSAGTLADRKKYQPLTVGFPLEALLKKLRGGIPSSEEHLEDQRMCVEDAETPSSEYPSTNPLYTWRALRLLGREEPTNLAGAYGGDLVKTMKQMDSRGQSTPTSPEGESTGADPLTRPNATASASSKKSDDGHSSSSAMKEIAMSGSIATAVGQDQQSPAKGTSKNAGTAVQRPDSGGNSGKQRTPSGTTAGTGANTKGVLPARTGNSSVVERSQENGSKAPIATAVADQGSAKRETPTRVSTRNAAKIRAKP